MKLPDRAANSHRSRATQHFLSERCCTLIGNDQWHPDPLDLSGWITASGTLYQLQFTNYPGISSQLWIPHVSYLGSVGARFFLRKTLRVHQIVESKTKRRGDCGRKCPCPRFLIQNCGKSIFSSSLFSNMYLIK